MNAMGCTVDYDGTIKARESASERLYVLGAIVMVLIVLLLSSALGSVRRAMLTLVNIPLCLVGGIVAVFLRLRAPCPPCSAPRIFRPFCPWLPSSGS